MFNLLILKTLTFLSIFFCICLITTTNPIYSAFILIILFLLTSIIFLILNIKFLTFVIIILYAGAISILFLFIIFTLNLKQQALKIKANLLSKIIVFLSVLKLNCTLVITLLTTSSSFPHAYTVLKNKIVALETSFEFNEIELIGNILYAHYWFLFLIISYILLLVMIGIVIIAKSLNFETTLNS